MLKDTPTQAFLGLIPEATTVLALNTANTRKSLLLASLDLLQFVHLILVAPYLSPTTAHTMISAWKTVLQWEGKMVPLLTWLLVALLQSFPDAASLPPIELAGHMTVRRKRLLKKMVTTKSQLQIEGASK